MFFTKNFRRTKVKGKTVRKLSQLIYSKEVRHSIDRNEPIVALESTIITHGMPFPQNYECALEVEETVRNNGATPATIALINGKIHIGMEKEQIYKLSDVESYSKVSKVVKASRKDLPFVIAKNYSAGTTVAATMFLAHKAGISVFATGGIGGVHRGAFDNEPSLDVSADLTELGTTPVAVVCAGIKSILDINLTLEYLETQGVTVSTYQTTNFPSFFSNSNNIQSSSVLNDENEAAKMIYSGKQLGLQNGYLIAVPNPNPLNNDKINETINRALLEAKYKNIKGKDVTPFLLKKINELSEGKSQQSNQSLVINNAKVGAQISVKLKTLENNKEKFQIGLNLLSFKEQDKKRRIWVVGGANEDISIKAEKEYIENTSSPSIFTTSLGGVGLNMCTALARLRSCFGIENEIDISFVSALGNDSTSSTILTHLTKEGIDKSFIQNIETNITGKYIEQLSNNGEMIRAFSDMKVNEHLSTDFIKHVKEKDIILFDANLTYKFYKKIFKTEQINKAIVAFETTSIEKSKVILPFLNQIDFLTSNEIEMQHLTDKPIDIVNLLKTKESKILVKRGSKIPELYLNSNGTPCTDETLENVIIPKVGDNFYSKGCGDTFTAAFCFATYVLGMSNLESTKLAVKASKLTGETPDSVAKTFNSIKEELTI